MKCDTPRFQSRREMEDKVVSHTMTFSYVTCTHGDLAI